MSLIPWRTKRSADAPAEVSPVSGFRGEMDRLFDSFLRDAFSWSDRPWSGLASWGPAVDIEESDHEVHVRAEIPGVKAEEVELSVAGNMLVISGEKKASEAHKERGYVYQERRFGSFRREVPLPTTVDPDDVHAEYKDGVLNVTLKKTQAVLPKRIPIRET